MTELPLPSDCVVCGSQRISYALSHGGYRIVRCADCGVMFTNPQPSDAELTAIYNSEYFLGGQDDAARQVMRTMKRATAREYLSHIRRYHGLENGSLLEIGCGDGDFLVEAEEAGFQVTGVDYSPAAVEQAAARLRKGRVLCGELEDSGLPNSQFDVCVLSDVIEHVRDPQAFLRNIHRLLTPNGTLFIATPSLASWSAKLLRHNWMEFKPEHLTYFDPKTIQIILRNTGFHEINVASGWKILTCDYACHHFERFPVPFVTPFVRIVCRLMPPFLRHKHWRVVASGMMVFSRKTQSRPV